MQLRALADQLYRSPHQHRAVRKVVCDQLRSHPEQYAEYVPGSFEQYRHSQQQDGTWGDHVTLQVCLCSVALVLPATSCLSVEGLRSA